MPSASLTHAAAAVSPSPGPDRSSNGRGAVPADPARLRALAEAGAHLYAGIRHGQAPQQETSISYEERRQRSSTAALWPVFSDGQQ